METNNEAALIETALQRSALDAAGLTGITTEHIARMVVAFGLQPYHLIEKVRRNGYVPYDTSNASLRDSSSLDSSTE